MAAKVVKAEHRTKFFQAESYESLLSWLRRSKKFSIMSRRILPSRAAALNSSETSTEQNFFKPKVMKVYFHDWGAVKNFHYVEAHPTYGGGSQFDQFNANF